MSIREALADRTNANNDSSRILFSSCKGETHTPKSGFRQLSRRLRTLYKTDTLDSRDDFTLRSLSAAALVVLGNPQQKFTAAEFEVLKQYLGDGGSVLIFSSEGGESQNSTNLNYLIEEFGINVNSDCVVRLSHDKYLHPKEALIADGILNRQVTSSLKGSSTAERQMPQSHSRKASRKEQYHGRGADFLYVRGATLSVQKPSVPFLGTGQVAYPMRRPVGALWQGQAGGKLVVLGSVAMFDDKWLDSESNGQVMDWLFRWLKPGSDLQLDVHDTNEPNILEPQHVPNTEALAEGFRGCLQEGEQMPEDWRTLVDAKLYSINTNSVPEVMSLYDKLGVKRHALTLIQPQFEAPLPPLQPAVFPPAIREPPGPALELFDLDECFATDHERLGCLTNKCMDSGASDLEYYVQESAHILGLQEHAHDAKAVLAEVLAQVAAYKMGDATLQWPT
ncbi:hypothetical protein ABBQ32_002317 [Trebouxia sp. C0010 RCD-2024]